MNFDIKVKKQNPGLCRCCLSEGCYKDLGTEYTWMNENEIYADMLLECFDISITQHTDGPNGNNRLICEVCVVRLRDACNFKKQVLASERKFVDMIACGQFQSEVIKYQAGPGPVKKQLKEESPSDNGDVEYLDDMDSDDNSPMNQVKQSPKASVVDVSSSLKVKTKRERPIRPKRPVKPETKPKVPRMEVKPHSSKPDVKGLETDEPYTKAEPKTDPSLHTKDVPDIKHRNILELILNSYVMPFRWLKSAFRCFYCYDIFRKPTELKEHSETHCEADKRSTVAKFLEQNVFVDVSNLCCKICFDVSPNLDELIDHLVEEHGVAFDKDTDSCIRPFKLNDSDFTCCDCEDTFELFGALLQHTLKGNHDDRGAYLCDSCGAKFTTKQILRNHINAIHNKRPIKCKICDVLMLKSQRNTHMQRYHNKTYSCEICQERFPSYYRRMDHMMVVHNNRTKRKCPECSMTFVFNSVMQRHIKEVHLQEKRVECSECGWQSFTMSRMKRHLLTHDDNVRRRRGRNSRRSVKQEIL